MPSVWPGLTGKRPGGSCSARWVACMHPGDRERRIAIRVVPDYVRGPLHSPFRPGQEFPELKAVPVGYEPNETYTAVRQLLHLWDGPAPHEPRGDRSPLAAHIRPGMRVAVKPNLVLHQHPEGEDSLRAMVTDAAVLRVVLDYVAMALRGDGTITVAESPIRVTDFGAVVRWSGLDRVLDDVASLWGVGVELIDIRDQTVQDTAVASLTRRIRRQTGDPRGGVTVNLGPDSALEGLGDSMARLRSTAAVGKNEVRDQHLPGRHVYELSRSVLEADAIINVPKLKTHKKAGMTGAMKNFVGAVVRKEWLPHHRRGAPSAGGDEYAEQIDTALKLRERTKDLQLQYRAGRWLINPGIWIYRHTIKDTPLDVLRVRHQSPMVNGGWSGNDTCWRMVHDVLRAVLYARADGTVGRQRARFPLSVVDGLIAGEGDGPLKPSPRTAGILMMGFDPPWIDYFATLLMGYDPAKIALVARAVDPDAARPLTSIRRQNVELTCEPPDLAARLSAGERVGAPFIPPAGWARHLVDDRMYERALRQQMKAPVDY